MLTDKKEPSERIVSGQIEGWSRALKAEIVPCYFIPG